MVKRVVVGAHYGLGSWLAQRITAVVMALYTVFLLGLFTSGRPVTYALWQELFTQGWMRVATLLFVVSLVWHAWVGVRDIVMDYARHDGLRLGLQVLTIVILAAYLGWTVQILWR